MVSANIPSSNIICWGKRSGCCNSPGRRATCAPA